MNDKTLILKQDTTIIDDKTIIKGQDRTIIQKQAQDEEKSVINKKNDISGYQTIKHISSGGESDIYLAEKGDQKYILKIYRKGFKPDTNVTKRIMELSGKYPEFLVQLYEFFFKDDIFHEIYEYCKLGSLADIMRAKDKRKKLKSKDIILELVRQINSGLKILHQNNIYHRDLKPSNILLRKWFNIALSDFGIARQAEMSTVYTQGFKGTYIYSAPETFGNQFTKKSDYWSLGIILYEIIKGKNPFSGLSQQAIIATLLTENQEPVEINIEDKELERLLKGLLTRNPKKRWGSNEVDRFLRGKKVEVYYNEKETSSKKIDIEEWALYGFTEKTAKGWVAIGATPKQAYEFKKARFVPIEARDWIKAGIDVNSAKKWINLGIEGEKAGEIKKHNIKPEKVEEYVNKGIHPEDAIEAIKYGIFPEEVKEFINKGFSLEEARDWKINDFSPDKAKYWKAKGFLPFEAKNWKIRGFLSDEAKSWKDKGFFMDEATNWKLNKFSPDEARDWKLNGFTPNEARSWKINGFSAYEAKKFIDYEFSLYEATNWKLNKFSPDEARDWKLNGFTPNEARSWKVNGFPSDEAVSWKVYGFLPYEAKSWKESKFSPDEAKKWKNYGFYADEARNWEINGFSPDRAKDWKISGFLPNEAKDWLIRGFSLSKARYLRDLKEWEINGFSPDEAKDWRNNGFILPEAKNWKEKGFSPNEAKKFIDYGFSLYEAINWKVKGFSPDEAKSWKANSFSPDKAKSWKESKFSPYEAKSWKENVFSLDIAKKFIDYGFPLYEAKNWVINGFSPDEAKDWIENKFSPDEAKKWKNNGFSPDKARDWKDNGFTLSEAKDWEVNGFSPDEAKDWIENKFSPDEAKKLKENVSSLDKELKVIFSKPFIINSKKHIKGHLNKNTELVFSNIEINTTDEVIFEYLNLISLKEFGDIVIKSGRVIFRNIRCSGIQIRVLGGELIFEGIVNIENIETALLLYSGKAQGIENIQLYEVTNPLEILEKEKEKKSIDKRKVEIYFRKKAELHFKKPVIISHCILNIICENSEKVKFINYGKSCFIAKDGGIIKMKNIEITHDIQEKHKEHALLAVYSNAEIVLDNCIIRNSPGEGIMISSYSSVNMSNCIVEGCGGTGVYIEKGKLNIEGATVSNNKGTGIHIKERSKVEIKNTMFYRNGKEGLNYPQIWIEDSKVSIKKVFINNVVGRGIGILIDSGIVDIRDSKITKNIGGIGIKGSASVLIENCLSYDNGQSDYNDGIGVYSDKALVIVKNVSTWGNKRGLSYRNRNNVQVMNCDFKDGITTNTNCFITTAVINTLNKPDNCYELNCLRDFRDKWLIKQEDGELLIKEYYRIAPLIVDAINKEPEADKIYLCLWENYISKCIKLIKTKKYMECKSLYTEMIERLKKQYLINQETITQNNPTNLEFHKKL